MIRKPALSIAICTALAALAQAPAQAEVTITAVNGECQSTTGGHAHATAFFNRGVMKNVIATNNEFQSQGGNPVAQDTRLRFDVWQGQREIEGSGKDAHAVSLPGTCIGHITVDIPGGTNQGAQLAIEDYLKTPRYGQGIIVRTGQLDKQGKLDLYVDIKKPFGLRQIVWNNFVGMPNPSGEMSMMRFERGQYFSCVNSGATQGTLQFQVFDLEGNFRGVTDGCDSAPMSVHVTRDVTTLDYVDANGNPVDISAVIGRGIVKMTGRPNAENGGAASPFTSAVALYETANPGYESWFPFWDDSNLRLMNSTITFARRNAGNDTLDIGQ